MNYNTVMKFNTGIVDSDVKKQLMMPSITLEKILFLV
jgi:hypothetical protein